MIIQRLVRQGLPALAYMKTTGSRSLGAIFCSGFMSDMQGKKGNALHEYFLKKDYGFVRFDKTFVGESVDDSLTMNISFLQWKNDLMTVIDQIADKGPQILIGSSVGGWLSILAALERPERIKGLLLVGAGVDAFTKRLPTVPPEVVERAKSGEIVLVEGPYGTYPVSWKLLEESLPMEVLSREGPLEINCPVRIFHGMQDPHAPFEDEIELAQKFKSENVEILLRKAGHHSLSTDYDQKLLLRSVDSLLNACQAYDN